jgi:lipopolysaccharide/colanic/teichoic acid biosynthesis glycosyltransferase
MGSLYRRGGKRLADIALVLAGLAMFAFPMAWIAWRIRRESGRPVLFKQIRLGYRSRPFVIFKFRTMSNTGAVSPLGRRLRAAAMDEVLQLFNILKGQMSFVGPRPLVPSDLEEIKRFPPGERRFHVRPGLTGLAQIHAEKFPPLSERLEWDLKYVEQHRPWLDLSILIRSVGISLRGAWEKPAERGRDASPNE